MQWLSVSNQGETTPKYVWASKLHADKGSLLLFGMIRGTSQILGELSVAHLFRADGKANA